MCPEVFLCPKRREVLEKIRHFVLAFQEKKLHRLDQDPELYSELRKTINSIRVSKQKLHAMDYVLSHCYFQMEQYESYHYFELHDYGVTDFLFETYCSKDLRIFCRDFGLFRSFCNSHVYPHVKSLTLYGGMGIFLSFDLAKAFPNLEQLTLYGPSFKGVGHANLTNNLCFLKELHILQGSFSCLRSLQLHPSTKKLHIWISRSLIESEPMKKGLHGVVFQNIKELYLHGHGYFRYLPFTTSMPSLKRIYADKGCLFQHTPSQKGRYLTMDTIGDLNVFVVSKQKKKSRKHGNNRSHRKERKS